ncbi:MAG: ThiF family adenylyltransferase [Acidobacteriaceae bacterium]|nr:ThiF family adenylyltransferase [Acidobacteriaceae bacterium]
MRNDLNRHSVSGLKVVLVGAGALGNGVFKILGLLGVGDILIVDPDRIEPSNLSRSTFLREADQTMKAEALRDAGNQLFPDTHWSSAVCEIADVGYQDLLPYQMIFGCVDNDLALIEISIIANKLGIPYMDGGLGGSNY